MLGWPICAAMHKLSFALCALALASPIAAQPLTPAEQDAIDTLVTKTLEETSVPAASIAVVRDGKIVLAKAYGKASDRLGPATRHDAFPDRVKQQAIHRRRTSDAGR